MPNRLVRSLDTSRRVAVLDDGSEMPYDLFLGIPKHRVPQVVADSGLTEDGWIPVDTKTLKTKFENVFAIGDVNSVGTPKAGVFAEGAARTVAEQIIAQARGGNAAPYRGIGSCYIEFGSQRVGKVEVEFLAGPPTGTYTEASTELVKDKMLFGSTRRAKWFGL